MASGPRERPRTAPPIRITFSRRPAIAKIACGHRYHLRVAIVEGIGLGAWVRLAASPGAGEVAQMLLHFIVISLFTRQAPDVRLGPKDPDLAHQTVASQMRRMGLKPHKPFDPMWYLTSNGKFVGYVKVFRNERYARNWFRDLSEQENSENIWAYWRDGGPVAMREQPNTKGANQFADSIALCRIRAFSEESAAQNGVSRWFSGNLTATEIFLDEKKRKAEGARRETNINRPKRSASVDCSDWEVRRDGGIDGPPPSAELSRKYRISGLAPPEPTAIFKIVCRLQSDGLERGIESEGNNFAAVSTAQFLFDAIPTPHVRRDL
jgi:hypothetical protein